nr:transporter substrate-binding domain-containing protein [uncultured Desulfobacter sp.]
MKKLILMTVLALFIAGSSAHAEERPLKVAIEGAYAPFNYLDAKGTPMGFEIDLTLAVSKEIGIPCEFVVLDWDGIIPGLLARKVDMVAASMSITPERKQAVAFSKKYYAETGSFVGMKDAGIEISAKGLAGKKIGVQRATTWNSYVEGVYPDAKIVFYDEIDRGCLDLLAKRIDLVLSQTFYMTEWLKKEEAKPCTILGEPVKDTKYIGEGIGFAMRKQDKELLAKVNAAIDTIRADGTYQKITDKYFNFDIYGGE